MGRTWTMATLGALAAVAAGCGTDFAGEQDAAPQPNVDSTHEQASNLDDEFSRAAADFGVPVELLQAVAYGMTQWQMVEGEVEFEGREARFGIMGVPEVHLEDLAERLNTTAEVVATDRETNIRAGAARLTELANGLGIDRSDLGAWAPAVAAYSEIPDEDGMAGFVHLDVYRHLGEGVVSELGLLPPIEGVDADYVQPTSGSAGGDGRGAVWRPSPNSSSRSSGAIGDPSMVIVHTCEGSYSGCWGWLTNSSSGVSAHYVVNPDGTEVSQLVSEDRKAWHIGASYDCDLNSGVDCWRNGAGSNNFTIGIEHAGYASQASWSTGLVERSAALLCEITADWEIPLDRYHVVGHGQLQPYNRVDPGPNWPWTEYLERAAAACGDDASDPSEEDPVEDGGGAEDSDDTEESGASRVDIVIDSNPSTNGPDAVLEASGYWTASNNVSGFYNTGYLWRSTASDADAALFWFFLESDARLTVEAWWPDASDRSRSAPFVPFDASGSKLDTVYVDQFSDGRRWVELGTWEFTAGWNHVALSRWTTPGYVVIADAVRVRSAE